MLILLDIDGVMVPASAWKMPELLNDGFPAFSMKAVNSLNKIISATNASIVLTTSHKSSYTINEWKLIFNKRGVDAKVSKLKNADKFQSRKEEILNWYQSKKNEQGFVIIDDDKSLHSLPTEIKDRLILTSPLVGLNEDLANKAIESLLHQTPMEKH